MSGLETLFFWLMVALYGFSSAVFLASVSFKKLAEGGLLGARILFICAFLSHVFTIAARWGATGHPPLVNDYEDALLGSSILAIIFLGLQGKRRQWTPLGAVITPIILLMLGMGLMSQPELDPMTPTHKSLWLYVHVLFAQLAYGSFFVAFALGLFYLIKERRARGNPPPSVEGSTSPAPLGQSALALLPAMEALDDLAFRFITFGFLADTVMIFSGSVWAAHLRGQYWSWDPVETWSLITWLVYGLYLHFRFSYHWRGKKAAWFAVVAALIVAINFWGIRYASSSFHMLFL